MSELPASVTTHSLLLAIAATLDDLPEPERRVLPASVAAIIAHHGPETATQLLHAMAKVGIVGRDAVNDEDGAPFANACIVRHHDKMAVCLLAGDTGDNGINSVISYLADLRDAMTAADRAKNSDPN